MKELVGRKGALARRRGGGLDRSRATAASTASVSFDAEAVSWADLPRETRNAARRRAPVLTEDVTVLPDRRLAAGVTWQDAVGWRLHEDAVVLAEVARPVVVGTAGEVTRKGTWVHVRLDVRSAHGPLRRRTGVVAVVEEAGPDVGTAGAVGVRPDHRAAAGVWRHLPLIVREAAEHLVPEPEHWWATLVQHSDGLGRPLAQELRCLRMSTDRAVAVVASRSLGGVPAVSSSGGASTLARMPWAVHQIGFDLGPATQRPAERIGGR